MGNVGSSLNEHPALYTSNPERFRITEIIVSNSSSDPYITFTVSSNKVVAVSNTSDLLEFAQDPDTQEISFSQLLPKFVKDKHLKLTFKFSIGSVDGDKNEVKGLTFINVANEKELVRILTVEFNDDPNLHKHPNVALVGNFETDGTEPTEHEWTWKWTAPQTMDEIHNGWRNYCCFVEYDAKENAFLTLSSFTFWVAETVRFSFHRHSKSSSSLDGLSHFAPSSSPSFLSNYNTWSPGMTRIIRTSSPENSSQQASNLSMLTVGSASTSVSNSGRRTSDDFIRQHEPEDGPLFRATLTAFEKKTGSLRHHIKRIMKTAANNHEALQGMAEADDEFISALKAAAAAHPQAFQPILENYLEEAMKMISTNRETYTRTIQVLLIEPLRKLYENDIKVADAKKKAFDEESRDYYQFLSKYLSIKPDSAKEKKKLESDSKYQNKRKNFELKRFDYHAYMQDLHGGRKDQEILYHLTNFAEKQLNFYQQTAAGLLNLKPNLDKLTADVAETAKEMHLMRKEREERRRALEQRSNNIPPMSNESLHDGDMSFTNNANVLVNDNVSDSVENGPSLAGSPPTGQNKFKGIRDLEQHDAELASAAGRRKEGFLFATPRATQHGAVDQLAKNTWHKYWCVLAEGQLREYSNWKKQLETHNEPINLRFATVKEARGADRRFCFEVITPQYRRIYQATSAEDMASWMAVISNAIESLLNGTSSCRDLNQIVPNESNSPEPSKKKQIKRRGTLSSLAEKRRFDLRRGQSFGVNMNGSYSFNLSGQQEAEDETTKSVAEIIKNTDPTNCICADCGSKKTEWCSINLGVILCIECSGIHRSLGTHVSKIRSLTLDTTSYTPDLVELIKRLGNTRSNEIWEATLKAPEKKSSGVPIPPPKNDGAQSALPPNNASLSTSSNTDSEWEDIINAFSVSQTKKLPPLPKPTGNDPRVQKQKFIIAKYVDRSYVDFSLVDEDRTATDMLFEAVKENDIPRAMQAIALRADVNTARRFEVEGDHGLKTPLLLSLLHIDDSRAIQSNGKLVFPMAELLLQNGALAEHVLVDDLEEALGLGNQTSIRASTKSVGEWAAEVIGDLKRNKTTLETVQASGNDAAIRYLTPKVLARGTSAPNNGNTAQVVTTSTGGVVGGTALEKRAPSNLTRSLSMSVKNVLLS